MMTDLIYKNMFLVECAAKNFTSTLSVWYLLNHFYAQTPREENSQVFLSPFCFLTRKMRHSLVKNFLLHVSYICESLWSLGILLIRLMNKSVGHFALYAVISPSRNTCLIVHAVLG